MTSAKERRARGSVLFRSIDRLSALSGYVSGALIILSMLVVCYAVLLRYVFGASTVWQTELAIYFLMFAAFVGGAYGLRHGDHVRINLAINLLPGRTQLIVRFLAATLGFLLLVTIAAVSGYLWWETTMAGHRSGTAWNPPLAYPYAIVPLGMTLMALQYLIIMTELFRAAISNGDGEPVGDIEGGTQH